MCAPRWINVGTAVIASTVGTRMLGSPIVIGLSSFNTTYIGGAGCAGVGRAGDLR